MRSSAFSLIKLIRQRNILILVFLAGITLFLFYPALGYYFSRDDFGFFPKENYGWLDLPKVIEPVKGWFYRPFSQQFYFFVNYQLFGLNATGFHAGNLLFHFLSSLLVFLIIERMIKNKLASLVGSVFFLASRIHLMSVYWISAFTEISGTFFYLLAFYLFLIFLEKKKEWLRLLSILALILGLLSRETPVTFPIIIILYLVLFREFKLTWQKIKEVLVYIWPYLSVSILYLGLYKVFVTLPTGPYSLVFEPIQTIKTALNYTLTIFVTSADKQNPYSILNGLIILRIFLIGGALALITFSQWKKFDWEKWNLYVFGIGWFYLTMLPFVFVPEHAYPYYLSIPIFGLALILAKLCLDLPSVNLFKKSFLAFSALMITLNIGIGKTNQEASSYLNWVKDMQSGAKVASQSLEKIKFEAGETVFITPSTLNSQAVLFFGELIKAHNVGLNLKVKFLEPTDLSHLPSKYTILRFEDDRSLSNITEN